MGYQSKRTIGSMIAGVICIIVFIVFAMGSAAPALDDLSAWAKVMLIFIGVAVVFQIVVQILFHIAFSIGIAVKEGEENVERILESDMVEDERDKQISSKAAHIGYIVAGGGFLVMLVLLALGFVPTIAILTLFISFFVGSLIEGCVSVYLAERGV